MTDWACKAKWDMDISYIQEVQEFNRWERCKLYYHKISAISKVAKGAMGTERAPNSESGNAS